MPSTAWFMVPWPTSSRSTPLAINGTSSISPIVRSLPGSWDSCMSPCLGDTKRSQTLLRCRKVRHFRISRGSLGDVITTIFKPFGRGLGLLAAGIAVLALGGCGGVEFQGAVFDWVGLSGTGTKGDVRMSERAPLLVPPNIAHLPPPGSPPIARADWPVDTDVARKQLVAAKEA